MYEEIKDSGLRQIKNHALARMHVCKSGSVAYRIHVTVWASIYPSTSQEDIVRHVRLLKEHARTKERREIYARWWKYLEKVLGPAVNGVE